MNSKGFKLAKTTEYPFLIALILLLLNDHYLKEKFHNGITGKLSDFCGLFIFPFFWSVLFPTRKREIYFSTALLFVLWKSPWSQSFINSVSSSLYSINRVIDITDLTALTILPLSFLCFKNTYRNAHLNPWIAGVITVFTFCATSVSRPFQAFENPQYILLKTDSIPEAAEEGTYDLEVHKFRGMVVVEIKRIFITEDPVLEDDYQKTRVQKDLTRKLLSELNIRRDISLPAVNSITVLIISHSAYNDFVSFKGSRLDGSFKRVSVNNELLAEGYYKNGIEDSTWSFFDKTKGVKIKKTYRNGEVIKVENWDQFRLSSVRNTSVRSDVIRNKCFQIAILSVFLTGLIYLIVKNYRRTYSEEIRISSLKRTGLSFILPIFSIGLAQFISWFLPNAYSPHFFAFIAELVLSYIVMVPLFLLVMFSFRIRTDADFAWYVLLLAVGLVLLREVVQLNALILR